jgi:hypothetical protein
MPHVIQPAPTARAKCRGCGKKIEAGELRFGDALPNSFGDGGGETLHWFHLVCGAYKRPETFLAAVEARSEPLEDADRLVAAARFGITHRRVPRIDGAERAPSGRAHCRSCHATIDKGGWRIKLVFFEEWRFVPSGAIHPWCAQDHFETIEILPRIQHFAPDLTAAELQELEAELARPKPDPPAGEVPPPPA